MEALSAAKELGVRSIGFLGFEGGKAKEMCDVPIVVASSNYGVIEDAHSVFMHMVTAAFKDLVQGVALSFDRLACHDRALEVPAPQLGRWRRIDPGGGRRY